MTKDRSTFSCSQRTTIQPRRTEGLCSKKGLGKQTLKLQGLLPSGRVAL